MATATVYHEILSSDDPPVIDVPQRPTCGYCTQEVIPSFAVVAGVALCQPDNAYQMDCHGLVVVHGQHLFDGRWWDGRWAAKGEPDPYARKYARAAV